MSLSIAYLEILKGLGGPACRAIQHVNALAGKELLRQALAEHDQQRHSLTHDRLEVPPMCRLRVPTKGYGAGKASMVLCLQAHSQMMITLETLPSWATCMWQSQGFPVVPAHPAPPPPPPPRGEVRSYPPSILEEHD